MTDSSSYSERRLPGGTIAFLLTDVEGSTALWDAAPDAMRAALARHDGLIVRTVERHVENVDNRLGISGKAGRAIGTAYALCHHLVTPA
jgi:class 3 adenylate cyclase